MYPTLKIPYIKLIVFTLIAVVGAMIAMDILENKLFETYLISAYGRGKLIYILEFAILCFALMMLIYLFQKIFSDKKKITKVKEHLNNYQQIDLLNRDKLVTELTSHPEHTNSLTYYRTILNLKLYSRDRKITETVEDDERFSEIMSRDLESNFEYIRYCIWVIPIFGFIGTLIGITKSVYGFSKILSEVQPGSESKTLLTSLENISVDLSSAFETTLPALFISASLALFLAILDRTAERLILQIDKFQIDEIIDRMEFVDDPQMSLQTVNPIVSTSQFSEAFQRSLLESNNEIIRNLELLNSNYSTQLDNQNQIITELTELAVKNKDVFERLQNSGIPIALNIKADNG